MSAKHAAILIQEYQIRDAPDTVGFSNLSPFIQQDTIRKVILTGKG